MIGQAELPEVEMSLIAAPANSGVWNWQEISPAY